VLDPLRFVEQLAHAIALRCGPYAEALLDSGEQRIEIHGSAVAGTIEPGGQATAIRIDTLQVGNLSAAMALERLIRHPLSQLAHTLVDPFVVVIDALDEALTLPGEETLVRTLSDVIVAGAVPRPLRFMLTSRPDPRVTDRLTRAPGFIVDLDQDVDAAIQDVRMYALRRLAARPRRQPEQLAEQIAQVSAGNFLYARHTVDDLLGEQESYGGRPLVPSGLDDIYTRFIERELARSDERWEDRYRPLLGMLAVAQGPGLPREVLAGANNLPPSRVDRVVRVLTQYLDSPAAGVPLRLYHESFREFLCTAGTYCVYPREAESRLVDWLLAQPPSTDPEGRPRSASGQYAFEHLATHAVALGRLDQVIEAGFLVFAEPFAMRRALRTSHSQLLRIYEDAFTALVGGKPAQRALALRLSALRTGGQALDTVLTGLLPEQVIRPSCAVINPSPPSIWQRPSLSVRRLAVGELGQRLAIGLLEDKADAPVIWEPETGAEHVVRTIDPDPMSKLMLTEVGNRPALIQVGHFTVAADAHTGEAIARAWSPGPTALLRRDSQAWLAEAHPVLGAIWVRPLGSADLWEHERSTIAPSAAQRALEPVVVLPEKVRQMHPIATTGDPLLAAITENAGELYLINPFAEDSSATGPVMNVEISASKPVASSVAAGRPLLAVAAYDEQIAVAVLDARTGEQISTLGWAALTDAIESFHPVGEFRVEEVNFLSGNASPKLLIRMWRADVLATWDCEPGQLDTAVMSSHVRVETARHAGQSLIVVSGDDGIRVSDQARALDHGGAECGPVSVIAAATVNGSALATWLAPGYGHQSTLWTVNAEGRVIDNVELPGSRPEFVALGHVHGTPVAVALTDSYAGTCCARWLDTTQQTIPVHLREGWPAELAGFTLADLSTVQHDSNLTWAARFLVRAVGAPLASGPARTPGMGIDRIAVAAGGNTAVIADLTGEQVSLHCGGKEHLQLGPVGERGTILGNMTVAAIGEMTVVAATVRDGVASRRILIACHDGRQQPRWQPIGSSRAYQGHLALGSVSGRAALALGDSFGVRLFAPLEPGAVQPQEEYFIPQPATALRFQDTGQLLIGTTSGVIWVTVG